MLEQSVHFTGMQSTHTVAASSRDPVRGMRSQTHQTSSLCTARWPCRRELTGRCCLHIQVHTELHRNDLLDAGTAIH